MNETSVPIDRLPIFPLSGVYLFPGVSTPLHIFERRYVDMTEDALAGNKLICVVSPDRAKLPLAEGVPAVMRYAGVGKIIRHDALPDGRYNIMLAGIGRIEILEELQTATRYRLVSARWRPSIAGGEDESGLADVARKLLQAGIVAGDSDLAPLGALLDPSVDTLLLSNALPSLLLQTPRAMQEMIEERSVEARLRYCIEHLQERLLSRAPGGKAN